MSLSPLTVEITLASLAIGVLVVDIVSRHATRLIRFVAVAGIAAVLVLAVLTRGAETILLGGSYTADGLAWLGKLVILIGAGLSAALSIGNIPVKRKYEGAYVSLLLFSTLGLLILVSSTEIVTLVVGLETSAVSVAGLVAVSKRDDRALEAGIKYLILGALSSGVLMYGLALLYAATGSTSLVTIGQAATSRPTDPFIVLGTLLALLGITFKLSAVPMHVWTPDVYQGAPAPITAFISVASKAAGFVFAARLFLAILPATSAVWLPVAVVVATLTMTVGNLAAIPQTSAKRLLAYSTISQAGYLLVGFVGSPVSGLTSVLFYLLVYTVTNIAAFAVVTAVSASTGSDELEQMSGLARRKPVLALAFTLALLSLAGIPPLAGFVGKFSLFAAAMERGYAWLVVVAALNSIVSLFYYLMVLRRLYILEPPVGAPAIVTPRLVQAVLLVTVAAILFLGVFPGPVMQLIGDVAKQTLGQM